MKNDERAVKYRGYVLTLGVREVDLGLFEPVAQARLEDSKAGSAQEVPFDRRWLMSLSEAWQAAEVEARRWVDALATGSAHPQPHMPTLRL